LCAALDLLFNPGSGDSDANIVSEVVVEVVVELAMESELGNAAV
jgi:hypothetical protein